MPTKDMIPEDTTPCGGMRQIACINYTLMFRVFRITAIPLHALCLSEQGAFWWLSIWIPSRETPHLSKSLMCIQATPTWVLIDIGHVLRPVHTCHNGNGAIWGPLKPGMSYPNLPKSWSGERYVQGWPIVLKFSRRLGSTAAEMPVKFKNDMTRITPNHVTSSRREIITLPLCEHF